MAQSVHGANLMPDETALGDRLPVSIERDG
jgi:hypothetical protein